MLPYLNTDINIYLAGVATPFVVYYVVTRFGAAIWQDIKVLAYSVWDKVKAKV
jgi:hypothetical protein